MATSNLPSRPPNPGSSNQPPPPPRPPMLAPGWTEHKAPTGHPYYYNSATGTSTYTRPIVPAPAPFATGSTPGPYPTFALPHQQHCGGFTPQQFGYGQNRSHRGISRGGRFGQNPCHHHQKLGQKQDRPKSKRVIPGATPWVLVTTKLGRKFAHNPETKVSLWKAPDDIQAAIDTMPPEDEMAMEPRAKKTKTVTGAGEEGNKEQQERGVAGPQGKGSESVAFESKGKEGAGNPDAEGEGRGGGEEEESEEGDEDEEEDEDEDEDEDEGEGEGESGKGDGHENKRLKTGDAGPSGPVEFTEEDIAWQLEVMAEDYGLGEEDFEESNDLTEEENINLFKEMLNDWKVNPYSTWDAEMPRIVEDTRYILITTTKRRKEVFTEWCKDRIVDLKAEKAKQKKLDPKIPFWAFLKENTNTKLYWPEFKRKFKKVPEMKDSKLTDKEKEKMYRDYISHIKISEPVRENDLKKLLKSTCGLSSSMTLDDLPESILIDVRYVTAPENIRDVTIKDYLTTLPEAPVNEREKREKEEIERKEQAIKDRKATVKKEQWRLRGEEQRARDMLREEEALIERAKIVSKKGLLGHIIKKEEDDEKETPQLDDGGKGRSA